MICPKCWLGLGWGDGQCIIRKHRPSPCYKQHCLLPCTSSTLLLSPEPRRTQEVPQVLANPWKGSYTALCPYTSSPTFLSSLNTQRKLLEVSSWKFLGPGMTGELGIKLYPKQWASNIQHLNQWASSVQHLNQWPTVYTNISSYKFWIEKSAISSIELSAAPTFWVPLLSFCLWFSWGYLVR